MEKLKKSPKLLKIVNNDRKFIEDHIDEIVKIKDIKIKNSILYSMIINKYILFDFANYRIVATYHENTQNIYIDFNYFYNNEEYFEIECDSYYNFFLKKEHILLFASTQIFKMKFNIPTYFNNNDINIFWDNIPNWKSRKDKIKSILPDMI